MNLNFAFVLLFVTLCFTTNTKPLSFTSELSFDSENEDFKFRVVDTSSFSLFNYHGIWYTSSEANAEKKKMVSGDFIMGSIYIGRKEFPVNWQAYYDATVKVNRTVGDGTNWPTFNVDLTSSFVAVAYLRLVEKNSTGSDKATMPLDSYWDRDSEKSAQLTNKTAGLYANVFNTKLVNGARVEILYILTQQAGTVDISTGVLVVPKAVETVITINDWPYIDAKNSLSLVMGASSADFQYSSSGQVTSGTDDKQVFFHVQSNAQVDGKMEDAKITLTKSKDVDAVFKNADVALQLKTRYSTEVDVGIFTVEFPAGAKEIVYDPTVGAGTSPYEEQGLSAGAIAAIVIISVVVVGLAVFAIMYYRKRMEYSQL